MSPARRHRRVNYQAIWAAIAATLVVHAAFLGTVQAWGIGIGAGHGGIASPAGQGSGAVEPSPPEPELTTTCSGDVLLATGARATMCLAPWNSDLPGCGSDVYVQMWMDLSACQGSGDAIAAAPIEMLKPREIEKLTPIDPERLLDEAMQQQLAKQEPPPPPPQIQPAQPPPPPPPAPTRPAQVVETAKAPDQEEPENARFLSEQNVNVKKQSVARGSVKEPMVAKSQQAELTPKQAPEEASVKELKEQDPGKNAKAPDAPGTLAMRTPGTPAPAETPSEARTRGSVTGEKGPIGPDGLPRYGQGMIEQARRDPGQESRGQGGAGGGTPQVPNLKPSPEVLERAIGGGSVDHLEEVESGDETALNAKRWVYASFFNRLKRQVAQNWDPASVWRRSDPNGTVHGFKTRVTEVRVTLTAKGDLQKIVVTSPSGVSELDDEAVRAFHASAPFPNPPDGLASKEGIITFAFSFHFEIGAPRTSWRVIRSM